MIRAAITLAALVLLVGCMEAKQAESSSAAGIEFRVDRLFTHDGCTVYRFTDAGYNRYFTRCDGSVSSDVSWSDSYQCGKARCTRPMNVPTARGEGQP